MPITDESRQKTRVYHREQDMHADAQTRIHDERIGFTQPLAPRRRMLDGISIAQVIAGAAATATSMLLASKIGIAGSVIGAAVSSAVTIVCSQLYRRALEKSAEKLKLSQLGFGTADGAARAGYGNGAADDSPYRSDGAPAARYGARIAPAALQIRAAEERRSTQRKVIVVSIGLAAVAVALTAGAILLGTAGQGLGERPAPLLAAAPAQQPTDKTPTADDAPDAPVTGNDASEQAPADNGANDTNSPSDETSEGDGETGGNGTGAEPVEPGTDGESEPKPEAPGTDAGTNEGKPSTEADSTPAPKN